MNCSALNLFLNTYMRLDSVYKRKLLSAQRSRNCLYKFGTCSRIFHSTSHCRQTEKDDDDLVLPSPQEVTVILRRNEFNKDFTGGSIKSYDSNQLASNDPIEDTRSEAKCKLTPDGNRPNYHTPPYLSARPDVYCHRLTHKDKYLICQILDELKESLLHSSTGVWDWALCPILRGLLMGVFDGHGGPACSQVVSNRLLSYIAAALLPKSSLEQYIRNDSNEDLLEKFNDKAQLVEELKLIYEKSFKEYLSELLAKGKEEVDVEAAMEQSILKFDSDLSREVVEDFRTRKVVNPRTLSVALSGAVACVALVSGPHLRVAGVGDCNAVLGTMADDQWAAKKITREHNAENYDELRRIWNEHPESERKTAIRRDRLLGELAPLRSLGDYRYKWPAATLSEVAVPLVGEKAIPANYHTPPYLSARPDVYYHRLTHKDKFLILASDGLWDMLSPLQAVKLVGEHMKGKVFFNPLKLPKKNVELGDINEMLSHRRQRLKTKPKDRNAATHLLRHAVGGTEYGVDHARLARLLSLRPDVSRMFRDDITVTVAFFDEEFLRQCPA